MKKIHFPLPSGDLETGFDCETFFNALYEEIKFMNAKEITSLDGEVITKLERNLILLNNFPAKGPIPQMQIIWSKSENRYILGPPLEGDYSDAIYHNHKYSGEGNIPTRETLILFELKRMEKYVPDHRDLLSFKKVQEYKKYLIKAKKKLSVKKPKEYDSVRRVLAIYLMLKFDKNEIDSSYKVKSKIEELLKLKIFPDPFNNEITLSKITSVHKQLNCCLKMYGSLQYIDLISSEFKKVITSEKNIKDYRYASNYLGSGPKSQMFFDIRINIKNLEKGQIIRVYCFPVWLKARVQEIATHGVSLLVIEGPPKGKIWKISCKQLEDPERYILQE